MVEAMRSFAGELDCLDVFQREFWLQRHAWGGLCVRHVEY